MRVLLINKYLYPRGGCAVSTINTGKLLKQHGHDVFFWGMDHRDNPEYIHSELFLPYVDYEKSAGLKMNIIRAARLLYNREARKKLERYLEIERIDIAHLNNFAHQLSPSIIDALSKHDIPMVMTMRDYKPVCPAYLMLNAGQPCERCRDGRYYNCFLKKCVKNSYPKSMLNTIEMYLHHNVLNLYAKINLFISPSKFLLAKVKEMGLKGEVIYLPNFVPVNDFIPRYDSTGNCLVYFGRLSREKGLFTALEAVRNLDCQLKIIGTGPIKSKLIEKIKEERLTNVHILGYRSGENLRSEIRNAVAVIAPSTWYENNPRSVMEAFASGKPVIGARIGGIPELVLDGKTGYTFRPGDPDDLRDKISNILNDPISRTEMGKLARETVEDIYSPEQHYRNLIAVYRKVLDI